MCKVTLFFKKTNFCCYLLCFIFSNPLLFSVLYCVIKCGLPQHRSIGGSGISGIYQVYRIMKSDILATCHCLLDYQVGACNEVAQFR